MSLVDYRVEGAVGLITLDRPPVNALSPELISAIAIAIAAAADPSVRAVVVTGSPHFAAGADIKGFLGALPSGGDRQAGPLSDLVLELEELDKPTIAAVRGYALGGGLELAMGCDFRYLAEGALVGQPEVDLGLIPGAGGTQRLPRLVGYQKAKELIMTGRHVAADEALRLGIADRVLPDEAVLDAALADAAEWAAGPTLAYAAVKRAMRGAVTPMRDGLARERSEFDGVFASEDARRGIEAFVGKTKPDFEGN